MVQTKAISREDGDKAKAAPAQLRMPSDTPQGTNYFIDLSAAETRKLIGSGPTDIATRTTLDLNLQNIAESVIARHLDGEDQTMNRADPTQTASVSHLQATASGGMKVEANMKKNIIATNSRPARFRGSRDDG